MDSQNTLVHTTGYYTRSYKDSQKKYLLDKKMADPEGEVQEEEDEEEEEVEDPKLVEFADERRKFTVLLLSMNATEAAMKAFNAMMDQAKKLLENNAAVNAEQAIEIAFSGRRRELFAQEALRAKELTDRLEEDERRRHLADDELRRRLAEDDNYLKKAFVGSLIGIMVMMSGIVAYRMIRN